MKSRIRSFTLIELLMVILVIAILLSLLFPSFGHAFHMAKHAKCVSTQKQFYTSLVLYSKNNKSSAPVFNPTWPTASAAFIWDTHKQFYLSLLSYTGNLDVFHCSYNSPQTHAINKSSTCNNNSGLLNLSGCKSLYYWGVSIPVNDIKNERDQRGLPHNSPVINSSQYYAYDQPSNFSQIKGSQPLVSDAYHYYNSNINRSRIHNYNNRRIFAQVNGDGAAVTAKESELKLLKANKSSISTEAGFYGKP